ncbi:MAG: hypothetical protein DRQ58_06225 [Gammaproteobacteria bacterium]|nr:MAG: hypothetical protein DRQ58_06225 [Gammaproteobacteria bacterium]
MKKTLHFKVLAGIVGMLLVLPTAGFSATTVDWGPGGNIDNGEPVDTMYVDATQGMTFNTATLDINGIVTVAPFNGEIQNIYNAPSLINGPYEVEVVYNTTNTTFTVQELDNSVTYNTVTAGGVTLTPEGDITAEGGDKDITEKTWDVANKKVIDIDQSSATYGQLVVNTAVFGEWDPDGNGGLGDFVELYAVDPWTDLSVVNNSAVLSEPFGGGSLTVDTGTNLLTFNEADGLAISVGTATTTITADGTDIALGATGDITLAAEGQVIISNSAVINGTLDVTGDTALADLTAGDTTLANLVVTGDTTTNGIDNNGDISTDTLQTSGLATLDSAQVDNGLNVDGATTTNGISNTGDVSTDTLQTSGLATLDSAQVDNDLNVDGATTTNGIDNAGQVETDTLLVNGNSDLNGDLDVAGHTYTDGITNDGTLTNNGSVYVSQNLDVNGWTYTDGLTNDGQLNTTYAYVTQDLEVGDDLDVYGDTSLRGELEVGGDTYLNNDLYVDNGFATVTVDNSGINLHVDGNSTDINMGADDIDITASGYIDLTAEEVVIDTPQLYVTGESDFGDTLQVRPLVDSESIEITPGGDTELPAIDNGPTESTVFTQTGSVLHAIDQALGGGVTIETNGNVTMERPDVGGVEIDYLQVVTFDVTNATGLPIAGTEEYIGGYVDGNGDFVYLGDLDEFGLLDLDALSTEELEAITTIIDADGEGGNLYVEGDAHVYKGDEVYTGTEQEFIDAHEVVIMQELDAGLDAEAAARIEGDLYLDDRIDRVKSKVDDLEDRVDAVGAFSAAFSALVPNDRVAGNTQVSLGLGAYAGETALAAGLFHYFGDNILVNAGVSHSMDESETAGRAGITFGF